MVGNAFQIKKNINKRHFYIYIYKKELYIMNKIKDFKNYINEELNPGTYKKAGEKLKSIGHKTRGEKLISYGSPDIEGSLKYLKNGKIEEVELKDIYYFVNKNNFIINDEQKNNNIYSADIDTYNFTSKLVSRKDAFILYKYLKKYVKYETNSDLIKMFIYYIKVNDLYKEEISNKKPYVKNGIIYGGLLNQSPNIRSGMEFNLEDEVICTAEYDGNYDIIDQTGEIVDYNKHSEYLIYFFNDIEGNDYNNIPDGHGWWVKSSKLKKVG